MSASSAWSGNVGNEAASRPSPVQDGTIDQLLRRYYRELTALAAAKLRNRDEAADLVQDAIVRFLLADRQGAQGMPPLANPRQFLRTIVSNLAVDAMRRNRRHGTAAPLDESLHVADTAPLADRIVAARQEYNVVRAILDDMPVRWRQALLLNRVESWSHARIARHLGVSPTMVAKYILCALRRCYIALSAPC